MTSFRRNAAAQARTVENRFRGGSLAALCVGMLLFAGVLTATPAGASNVFISTPDDMTVEATGPAGAVATYVVTATDSVDGPLTPVCTPPSGSTFPLGTTLVTCDASSAQGGSSGAFRVTVIDTTPPQSGLVRLRLEATGPDGVTWNFQPRSANDRVDGSIVSVCPIPSGPTTFPIGTTDVVCTVTDAHGNSAPVVDSFEVRDTTPPHLAIVIIAPQPPAGPDGITSPFEISATDLVDGPVPVICSPPLTSMFPLGDTTVMCTATDAADNTSSYSTVVTVEDLLPPVLSAPDVPPSEADRPDGAHVAFVVTAADLVDGNVGVACSPVSGSSFPIGTTTVSCSATDAHGNEATTTFPVTVADTSGPALALPANFTQTATGPSGAAVSYNPTAVDMVDGPVVPVCSPLSGSTFPIGTTTVTCTATDTRHNQSTGAFTITVQSAVTSTVVSSSTSPSTFGQGVTFTATVTSAAGTPVGAVQFRDGGTPIGSPVTLGAAGRASVTTSSLTVGSHAITADYAANPPFAGSSAGLTQVVSRAGVVLVAQPAVARLVPGLKVNLTLSARLTTTGGVPLGGRSIAFRVGNAAVCTASTDAAGNASCGGLLPGTLAALVGLGYTATFGGDVSYNAMSAQGALVTVLGVPL